MFAPIYFELQRNGISNDDFSCHLKAFENIKKSYSSLWIFKWVKFKLFSLYATYITFNSFYHSLGGAKPATGGECIYECITNHPNHPTSKECLVHFEPKFCKQKTKKDCNKRCSGRWGTNFSERVSEEKIPQPPPPRPGNY